MHIRTSAIAAASFALLLVSTACSSDNEGSSSSASPATSAAAANSVELTAANLGALERGLREELEVIRSADRPGSYYGVKLEARDPEAQRVAEAAGMSVQEYREIRDVVDRVFTTLNFKGEIGPPSSIDLEQVSDELRARIEGDPFAELSPESASALRGSMTSLEPLWSSIMAHIAQNG